MSENVKLLPAFRAYIQSFRKESDRDDALRARLAHITLGGQRIGVLTQDESLQGGYLGTVLTASLCPDAHLRWTKRQLENICKAVNRAPLPSHIRQLLLLYGADSKINHTHCLMALSRTAMAEVYSILEGTSRKNWHLPNTFPRAGLHAPSEELGLNIHTVWEDYFGSAIRSWTRIFNDEGALVVAARASYMQAAQKFKH
jgi:hypothetical protein